MSHLYAALPYWQLAVVMAFAVFLAGTMLVSIIDMTETRGARIAFVALLLLSCAGAAYFVLTKQA